MSRASQSPSSASTDDTRFFQLAGRTGAETQASLRSALDPSLPPFFQNAAAVRHPVGLIPPSALKKLGVKRRVITEELVSLPENAPDNRSSR
jgi:hypothetical protein